MIKYKLNESAVGVVGRTGKIDAQKYVEENPEIISGFKKMVTKMGGKAVAAEILNLNLFGKSAQVAPKYTLMNQI